MKCTRQSGVVASCFKTFIYNDKNDHPCCTVGTFGPQ